MKRALPMFLVLGMTVAAGVAAITATHPAPSPELLKKGKVIYEVNCLACHGVRGDGDGPVGIHLNPKPRNLRKDKFIAGEVPEQVFKTISNGLKGTAMVGFPSLSEEERWAVAYFTLSLKAKGADKAKADPAPPSQALKAPKSAKANACIKVSDKKPYIKIKNSFDSGTYNGFRRFNGMCLRCHGEGGGGSSFGPSLVESLKVLSKGQFYTIIANGRINKEANSVMPAFASNPDVMNYIEDIYSYMKARSNGDLGVGRPEKNNAKKCSENVSTP